MATPAETLRTAAGLIREKAEAVPQGAWKGRPWEAEECGDGGGNCLCIVSQGERKPYLEPQIPPIQYVCDAESEQHAAHIASWHPAVALAVADWLEAAAALIDAQVFPESDPAMSKYPLAVARLLLGETEGVQR